MYKYLQHPYAGGCSAPKPPDRQGGHVQVLTASLRWGLLSTKTTRQARRTCTSTYSIPTLGAAQHQNHQTGKEDMYKYLQHPYAGGCSAPHPPDRQGGHVQVLTASLRWGLLSTTPTRQAR